MGPDLKNLLRDKRFQIAAGLAAAVGLGVWWQRRQSASAGPGATSSTTGQTVGGLGSFDSTSTDVAAALGEQTGQIQDVLQQFLNQLHDTQAGAAAMGTAPTPTPTTPPIWSGPAVVPVTVPPVTVGVFTKHNPPWDSTLSGIAGHEHTTVAALQRLNGISNPDLIHPGQQIRIS